MKMLPRVRYRHLFGITATLCGLFIFVAFLNPTLAAPQQLVRRELSRRVGEAPGIGIEIEVNTIVIRTSKKELTAEELEEIKGREMTAVGHDPRPKTNWQLTAEYARRDIYPEAIVDGRSTKVGEGRSAHIGRQIFEYFDEWAPCDNSDSEVKIRGFDNLGPWKVRFPEDPNDLANQELFAPQVTTAMPLEAILEILKDASPGSSTNPLTSSFRWSGIKILTKEDFKSFSKIKPEDVTDEFLGFFSLLASYCINSRHGDKYRGPKYLLPIMPRTDLLTQYKTFIEPKLKDQLAKHHIRTTTTLYDIVQKVSGEGKALRGYTFKWVAGVITNPIDEVWTGKDQDIANGLLEVGKFLDYLQGFDSSTKKKLPQMDLLTLMDHTKRHGQMGGFGSRMETVLGTSDPAPIFEFRELDKVTGLDLGDALGSYEQKVIEYHEQYVRRKYGAAATAGIV